MIGIFLKTIHFLLNRLCAKSKKFHDIIYGTSTSISKKFIAFVYGLFIGLIFFYLIIRFIGFFGKHSNLAILITCFSSAFMCLLSTQFRCISILMWLSVLGKAGRSLIKTIIITLVLSGPILNIASNTKEVTRVFECTTYLTYNLTKTKVDLAITPFINAFIQMQNNISTVQASFNEIEDVVFPIIQEVEGSNSTNRSSTRKIRNVKPIEIYSKQYQEKLKHRCEMQLERGTSKCKQSFQKVYDDCLNEANFLICSPLKIDFICNLNDVASSIVKDLCDPSNVIDADFGDEYAHLKEQEMNFVSEYSNISFDFLATNPKELHTIKTLNETGRKLSRKLNEKGKLMDYIFRFCDKLMILIYLKIIYDSITYHDNYLSNINFNNYYITSYFKKIDERRIHDGRSSIFPVRFIEFDKIVDLDGSKKLRREFEGYLSLVLRLILHIIGASFFILLDRLYFELLDIIARHSRIEFEQEGFHHMNITVNGTGFIADLIRASVNGLNINKNVDLMMTNDICLPHPTLTKSFTIVQIYLLFSLNIYLIYNQVHIHRLKRAVCAYFYPKFEKRRIIFLYNKMLRERKKIFKTLVDTIKYEADMKNVNKLLPKFTKKLLKVCKCFRRFSFARHKCFICHVVQSNKLTKNSLIFWMCNKKECGAIFCDQCWIDVGRNCLICYIRRVEEERIKHSN
ncbi:protein sneaky [Chironomus tepperi]|uniref:protein sneaky n=1 Tax=Chironomus tepperi TaxID=113505 RepID=UPI00391FA73A